jgi:hypothetical protein
VPYETLKQKLKTAPWIKGGAKKIDADSYVMVDERRPATVKYVRGVDDVVVVYDKRVGGPSRDGRASREPKEETVKLENVNPRPKFMPIPTALVPEFVQFQAQRARQIIDQQQMRVVPAVSLLNDVLTWKKIRTARIIAYGSGTLALLLFIIFEWYRMCGDTTIKKSLIQLWLRDRLEIRCGSHLDWENWEHYGAVIHFTIAFILDHGMNTFLLLAGAGIFLSQARWLTPVSAIFRIIKRSLIGKRKAPQMWPFFREGFSSGRGDIPMTQMGPPPGSRSGPPPGMNSGYGGYPTQSGGPPPGYGGPPPGYGGPPRAGSYPGAFSQPGSGMNPSGAHGGHAFR